MRTFVDQPAVRARVPLLIGLVGASGSGKTYSALRVATGIQRVVGGEIGVIDTEARRALHYADRFKFRHLPFEAPFSPLDYLAAIEHFHAKGMKTIIVDSQSHEHEGPGGVLEMHEAETERLLKSWPNATRDKVKFSAWQKPKSDRRRLLNSILQLPVNFVFCFRAKEKLKITPGQQPKPLGWMPIAGEEFVFEMTLNCLLYPGSGGVPVWNPDEPGERSMVKLPEYFKAILAERQPLSEDIGEKLARWAEGGAAIGAGADEPARLAALASARDELAKRHPGTTPAEKEARKAAIGIAFGVASWGAVEKLPLASLQAGLALLTERQPGEDDGGLDEQFAASLAGA